MKRIKKDNIRLINNLNCTTLLFLCLLFSFSCNPEVDDFIESRPLAVVNCIFELEGWETRLAQNNTLKTNYVRLEKSYNGGQDANISAKISDSIYFDNADVRIQYCLEGNILFTTVLEKTYDIVKEPGMFSANDYFIYKTIDHIVPPFFDTVRLVIDIPGEDLLISSEAPYTPAPKITAAATSSGEINFFDNNNFSIHWLDEGCFYEEIMRIRYKELINGELFDRVLYWKKTRFSFKNYDYYDWLEYYNTIYINRGYTNRPEKIPKSSELSVIYYPQDFYRSMASKIEKNDSVQSRKLSGIDIFVYASTKYLREYMSFSNFPTDNENVYSNIKNGSGVFATSCSDSIINLKLNEASEDYLINGPYTKHLKFVY
ncbi:hypothetical protein ACFLTI_00870 [Bacteroidota bacterium]